MVRDFVEGEGTHDLDICWHFEPGIELVQEDGAVVASRNDERLVLTPRENAWKATFEEYDYSPVYGRRVPARRVRWSSRSVCPAELTSTIPKLALFVRDLLRELDIDDHVEIALAIRATNGQPVTPDP